MRGHQLCEISQHHLAEKFDCKTMRMPLSSKLQSKRNFKAARQMAWMSRCPRDAIYFVTKQCMERLNPTAAEILQWRARAVLFDYVDTDMETVLTCGADIHLSASNAQYEYMKKKKQFSNNSSVALLPHGYDYRLQRCAPTKGPVHTAYWGNLRNTYIPQSISNDISVIDGAVALSTDTLDELSRYRLHYCVRNKFQDFEKTVFKPLTKVANAAACGANILINHDAHDAVDFLGPDYPYFVNLEDDANIVNVFKAALNGAGGSDWLYALNAMNLVAKQLSPEQMANQLNSILRPLTD